MGDIIKRMMDAEAEANDDISAKRFDGTFAPAQSNSPTNQDSSENQNALDVIQSNEKTAPVDLSGKDIHQQLLQRALEREKKLKESKQERQAYRSDFDYSRSKLAGGSYKEYEFDSADQKQRNKVLGKKDTDQNSTFDFQDESGENNRSINKSSKIEEDTDSTRFRKRPIKHSERLAEQDDGDLRYSKHTRQDNNAQNPTKNSFKRPHFHEPQGRNYNPYA